MKSKFDVADGGVTAHSCVQLIALSRGIHSYDADLLVSAFINMHSDDFLYKFIKGIMKSTYKRAQQALPGGGNMK